MKGRFIYCILFMILSSCCKYHHEKAVIIDIQGQVPIAYSNDLLYTYKVKSLYSNVVTSVKVDHKYDKGDTIMTWTSAQ